MSHCAPRYAEGPKSPRRAPVQSRPKGTRIGTPQAGARNRYARMYPTGKSLPRSDAPPRESSPSRKNFPLSPSGKSILELAPSRAPQRGVSRSSRHVGRGMRWMRRRQARWFWAGRERCRIRRSRVVLAPRRWRQVRGKIIPVDDGGNKARSPGRARRKPLNPLRGECRAFPV
jgi:hypothetical protein